MSKGLEAFKKISEIYGNTGSLEGTYEYFLTIKRALVRLEAIENSNPSEALECLEKVYSRLPQWDLSRNVDQCNIIKQALLKAQEPKHYLKWEDLEFDDKSKEMIVRMGDNVYKMTYRLYENEGVIRLEDCQRIYLELFANEKKFFNDLRLERVE